MLEEEEEESETADGVDGTSQNEGVQARLAISWIYITNNFDAGAKVTGL